jgi:hypothetical protein
MYPADWTARLSTAPALAEFLDGGVPKAGSVAAHTGLALLTHLKSCPKCRSSSAYATWFSTANRALRASQAPPPPEFTPMAISTLCHSGIDFLGSTCATATAGCIEEVLANIAQALGMHFDEAKLFGSIRADPRFSALEIAKTELDRVSSYAVHRAKIVPHLRRFQQLQVDLGAFDAALRSCGTDVVSHKTSEVPVVDYHACAQQVLAMEAEELKKCVAEWEAKHRVSFMDAFSAFGRACLDLRSLIDPVVGSLDDVPTFSSRVARRAIALQRAAVWADSGGAVRKVEAAPDAECDDSLTEVVGVRPKNHMQVIVKVRPQLSHQAVEEESIALDEDGRTVRLELPHGRAKTFRFDGVFSDISQRDFFSQSGTAGLVDEVLEGGISTVFAYGQTGSGKTFSIFGTEGCTSSAHRSVGSNSSEKRLAKPPPTPPTMAAHILECIMSERYQEAGLAPRAMRYLFRRLAASDKSYEISVSFLELYNERLRDLLEPANTGLVLRQEGDAFTVLKLTRARVESTGELLQRLAEGLKNRMVADQGLNRTSSRSHAVLTVEVALPRGGGSRRPGRLVFADLAGSERQSGTVPPGGFGTGRSASGTMKETCSINQSLFTLSNAISQVAAGRTDSAQFRTSNLTKVLKDSLVGSGHTILVATVSSTKAWADESANTLAFAQKCASVVSREAKPSSALGSLEEARAEIRRLRTELVAFQKDNAALRSFLMHGPPKGCAL